MKVTVIGSHLCPDTLYALNRLSGAKAEIEFKNLSASLADLKVYLSLRQDSPVYADIREHGGIGIPCCRHRHPGSERRPEVTPCSRIPGGSLCVPAGDFPLF